MLACTTSFVFFLKFSCHSKGSKSSPYVQEWSEWRAYLTFEYMWLEVARGISAADTLPTWAGLHVLPISRFNAPRLQWATNYKWAVKLLVSLGFGSASLIHLVTGSVPFLLGTLWLGWVMGKWQPHAYPVNSFYPIFLWMIDQVSHERKSTWT